MAYICKRKKNQDIVNINTFWMYYIEIKYWKNNSMLLFLYNLIIFVSFLKKIVFFIFFFGLKNIRNYAVKLYIYSLKDIFENI